jgi:hypothetical protein
MSTARPSDGAIVRSIARTLADVIRPALRGDRRADPYARTVAVQLAGVARYAAARPADPAGTRRAELSAALDSLGANPIVLGCAGDDPDGVASAALVACIGRVDRDADDVRATLRPVLVGHLDDELAVTAPLIVAFRGRLPDA